MDDDIRAEFRQASGRRRDADVQSRIVARPPSVASRRGDATQSRSDACSLQGRPGHGRKGIDAAPRPHESTLPDRGRQLDGMRARTRQLRSTGNPTAGGEVMNPLHEPSLRSRATVMRRATEPVDKSGVWNAGEMARRAGDLSVATEKSRHPGEFSDGAERSGSGAGAERERSGSGSGPARATARCAWLGRRRRWSRRGRGRR